MGTRHLGVICIKYEDVLTGRHMRGYEMRRSVQLTGGLLSTAVGATDGLWGVTGRAFDRVNCHK